MTALDWAPSKLVYQTPSSPMSRGALRSSAAVAKCSSIVCMPSRNSVKTPGPRVIMQLSPIADPTEKRPPTQSQKPNTASSAMPNAATSSDAVETATKCAATASSAPRRSRNHRRAAWAFARVSWVVNVLEATITRVVSGSTPARAESRSRGSTFDT